MFIAPDTSATGAERSDQKPRIQHRLVTYHILQFANGLSRRRRPTKRFCDNL